MINRQQILKELQDLPLYIYDFVEPSALEFTGRVRWICENECPMYGKSWACPPGVGTVAECEKRCGGYNGCLMISTITEVSDIANIEQTLATRPEHEEITNQVEKILRDAGIEPYILSTEACALCERCAYLDGKPCRMPEKMHPCVESHGINVMPLLEQQGLEFQYGENVVTWISLLFFKE